MAQVLHRTFADDIVGGGGTGFNSISQTNGTVIRSDTAGLNGTTNGALFSRTADSPNVHGEISQATSADTVWRTAWWVDYSTITITTDTHETRLFHQRNAAGTLNPVVLYLEKESGALRFRFRVFTDSTNTAQTLAATSFPAWVEIRSLKESSDGAADGNVKFYFGGGGFSAAGQVVAEFPSLDNFGQFDAELHRWGLFQSEASVGGSTKVDEIIMRNDDTAILVGTISAPTNTVPTALFFTTSGSATALPGMEVAIGTNPITSVTVSVPVSEGVLNFTASGSVTLASNGTRSVVLQNGTSAAEYTTVLDTCTFQGADDVHKKVTVTVLSSDGTNSDSDTFTVLNDVRTLTVTGGTFAQKVAAMESLNVLLDTGEMTDTITVVATDSSAFSDTQELAITVIGTPLTTVLSRSNIGRPRRRRWL